MGQEAPGVLQALEKLVFHGWVSLRQLSAILDYKYCTEIYQRQRGRNRIDTIKIGGNYRIFEDEVVRVLKAEPAKKQANAQLMLRLLQTYKDKARAESIRTIVWGD